jgi:non-specific serine/threonine protein kinase/serine/threonine-protein kinase
MESQDRPTRIGPYQLHEVLGEGGMGTVYRAMQTDPVRREVALKIIKWGMDTTEVVARFRSEQQALAMMDHTGIAKVLDAGATETGRPYFVMEVVRGVPIDEYCDTHKLNTARRLELFARVCDAVHHAHQKGVIHRDLKPSNILVTIEGDQPLPKVIDFGIAKAVGAGLSDDALVTTMGQMLGTPAYMSPEQAEGSGLGVDTRADVYSLGVMLYELLSGALPFDRATLSQPDFIVQFLLRDKVVPTPSSRLGSLASTQQTVARNRATSIRTLRRELSGDLDWIVMMAMDKDRTRRYSAASELAADLRRYRSGEPVAARPPTATYRLARFAQRNRGPLAAGILLLLALVAGGTASTIGFVRADRNAQIAEAAAARAEAVGGFLDRMLRAADPVQGGESETTVRQVLDAASQEVAEGALADQPLVEVGVRQSIGATYMHLGLLDEAESHLDAAAAIAAQEPGAAALVRVQILSSLGQLNRRKGDADAAEAHYRHALALADSGGLTSDGDAGERAVNDVRNNLGLALRAQDRLDEAAEVLEALAASDRRLLDPSDVDLATTLNNLALVRRAQGDVEGAIDLFHETLDVLRAAFGERHVYVAAVLESIGSLEQRRGRYERADSLMSQSLTMRRSILGEEHPDIINGLNGLGLLHTEAGELDAAAGYLDEALGMALSVLGPEHPTTASILNNLGLVHLGQGESGPAEAAFRRSAAIREAMLGPEHRFTMNSKANLAAAMLLGGDATGAEAQAGSVVLAYEETELADVVLRGSALSTWGRALTALERYDEAEARLLQAHTLFDADLGAEHSRTQRSRTDLVTLYEAWGREDEAARWRGVGG